MLNVFGLFGRKSDLEEQHHSECVAMYIINAYAALHACVLKGFKGYSGFRSYLNVKGRTGSETEVCAAVDHVEVDRAGVVGKAQDAMQRVQKLVNRSVRHGLPPSG